MYFSLLIILSIIKCFNCIPSGNFCISYSLRTLAVKNFDNFSSLNISNCYSDHSDLRIIPNKYLILNKDLSLNISKLNIKYLVGIIIYHLKGIDMDTSIFKIRKLFPFIYIKFSYFTFYNKNKLIIENDCDSTEIYNSFKSLFSNISSCLTFVDCLYTQKICAYTFKNASIKYLRFKYQLFTILRKNYLIFSEKSVNFSLNSNIETAHFEDFYRINFNSKFFNDEVYKLTKVIKFYGSISKIQIDLFNNLNSIESIMFELDNLKEFVHKGLTWTDSLNNLYKIIKLGLNNYDKSLNRLYDYPNEDWCLFERPIFNENFKLIPNFALYQNITNLSCVLIGFLKNQNTHELLNVEWYNKCCIYDRTIFKNLLETCDLINCTFNDIAINQYYQSFDYYDFINTVFYLELVLQFILQPFILIFGILANIFVIFLLKQKSNQKDFKDKMYSYILYNSVFNLLIILLDVVGYIFKCSLNDFALCPIIRETTVAQYSFIVKNFFDYFFIFGSNLTLLFFSINRFIKLCSDDKTKFIKFFTFLDRHFFSFLIPAGIVLNILKFFEYKINQDYDTFFFPNQLDVEDFQSLLYCQIFFFMIFVSQLISNFLIQIFNLIIDILMFFKYKKAIIEKSKILNSKQNDTKNDNKMLRIIISFAIFNFFSRLPEIILYCITKYHILIYTNTRFEGLQTNASLMEFICELRQNCEKIFKAVQVLFKVTFLSNFLVLYSMNKLFRRKIKSIFIKDKDNKPKK